MIYLQLLTKYWKYAAVLVLVLFMYVKGRIDGVQAEKRNTAQVQALFDRFVAETEAEGLRQAAETKRINEKNDKALQEANDHEKAAIAAADRANALLLQERSRRRVLPEPPKDSRRPDLACYNRAEFESEIRALTAAVSGLLAEGGNYAIELKIGEEWAARLSPSSP